MTLIKATPLRKATPDEEAAKKRSTEAWRQKQEEDARLAVPRDIEKFRQEAAEKIAKADQLAALFEQYPDIRKQVGRWEKVAYYSKQVNTKVDRFDLRHSCGCCNGSPLELWPYLESSSGNIYSDPAKFVIGEKHWMGGDKPYANWKTGMQDAGIPESIIGAVSMHFQKAREERIASASEDGEQHEEDDGD